MGQRSRLEEYVPVEENLILKWKPSKPAPADPVAMNPKTGNRSRSSSRKMQTNMNREFNKKKWVGIDWIGIIFLLEHRQIP